MASGRGGESVAMSCLLFIDGALVFYDASKDDVEVMWFEAIFGLKINLHKSKLILVGWFLVWRTWLGF